MQKSALYKKLEEKITKEMFSSAEKLISNGKIVFCISVDKNDYFYTIIHPETKVITTIKLQDVISKLPNQEQKLTLEESAAILHHLNHLKEPDTLIQRKIIVKKTSEKSEQATSKEKVNARLLLYTKDFFPAASSTWEKCNISVKIAINNREYVGNINKLRQIRYDEDKSTSDITIQNFNSQSRQIIRFITQYAEVDGNGYSLRAETLSELFHCLIGFEDFYLNDQKIVIHQEKAELTTLIDEAKENTLHGGIKTGGKILTLSNPDIILGRSGIWIGVSGEYWWIDGTIDLMWLRNFLLSEGQSIESVKFHIQNKENNNLQQSLIFKCETFCYIDYSPQKGLIIQIRFRYGKDEFYPSKNRISASKDFFITRDKATEDQFIDDIIKMGFQETLDNNELPIFSLTDTEGIALFVEFQALKIITKDVKEIFFSPTAFKLLNSTIKIIKLSCVATVEDDTYLHGILKIGNKETLFKWKEILNTVKDNRQFILKDNFIHKIPLHLSKFITKIKGIVNVKTKTKDTIYIPRNSVIFWIKAAENIPSAIPTSWKELGNTIQHLETLEKTPDLKTETPLTIKNLHGTLRSYQVKAVEWMKNMLDNNCNFILADEMGLGKTIQTLALIQYCKENIPSFKNCLVICPTSLVSNWESEAHKFTPTLSITTIHGSDRTSLLQEIIDHDLIITSYAIIKRDIQYYNDLEFDLVVLDEAQHIKNSDTINARVCKQIKSKHKMVLTGTPLENTPEDIWAIFDFISHGTLGSKENFKLNYSKIENNLNKQHELSERIAPFILRRHKKEVEQLPEKIEQILFCEMSPEQQKIYNEILYKGKIECDSYLNGKSTRFNVLTSLLRLRQICCHPALLPDIANSTTVNSAKTDLLEEIIFQILDSKHRTLIFSQFTSLLAIIKLWCSKQKIPFEYLDGQSKNRQESVNNFNQNEEISLFLLSLKAGGSGLNLTGADTVIIYDPWWNPCVETQATDRTHRIGQKNIVTTIKLVMKNSIEEKILELQKRKQGLFNGIIESSSSFRKLSDKDLQFLLE